MSDDQPRRCLAAVALVAAAGALVVGLASIAAADGSHRLDCSEQSDDYPVEGPCATTTTTTTTSSASPPPSTVPRETSTTTTSSSTTTTAPTVAPTTTVIVSEPTVCVGQPDLPRCPDLTEVPVAGPPPAVDLPADEIDLTG